MANKIRDSFYSHFPVLQIVGPIDSPTAFKLDYKKFHLWLALWEEPEALSSSPVLDDPRDVDNQIERAKNTKLSKVFGLRDWLGNLVAGPLEKGPRR